MMRIEQYFKQYAWGTKNLEKLEKGMAGPTKSYQSQTKPQQGKNGRNWRLTTRAQTGGGEVKILTPAEENIFNIIKPVSVDGHQECEESIVLFEYGDENDVTSNSNIAYLEPNMCLSSPSAPSTSAPCTSAPSASTTKSGEGMVMTPQVRRPPKRKSSKWGTTAAAAETYSEILAKKVSIKEAYYKQKLILMEKKIEVKNQEADALVQCSKELGKITEILQKKFCYGYLIKECHCQIVFITVS